MQLSHFCLRTRQWSQQVTSAERKCRTTVLIKLRRKMCWNRWRFWTRRLKPNIKTAFDSCLVGRCLMNLSRCWKRPRKNQRKRKNTQGKTNEVQLYKTKTKNFSIHCSCVQVIKVYLQSTSDNSNLLGKLKKVRVTVSSIELSSSKQMTAKEGNKQMHEEGM